MTTTVLTRPHTTHTQLRTLPAIHIRPGDKLAFATSARATGDGLGGISFVRRLLRPAEHAGEAMRGVLATVQSVTVVSDDRLRVCVSHELLGNLPKINGRAPGFEEFYLWIAGSFMVASKKSAH